MIVQRFSDFRAAFGRYGTPLAAGQALVFIASNKTITRGAGSFLAGIPFAVDMTVDIEAASVAGNNQRVTIASLDATTLTVAETIYDEGPTSNVVLRATYRDVDGFETWPVAQLRAGGFDDGITGLPAVPNLSATIMLTCNAQGYDAVNGVDEYDWYVSQRSDETSGQFWAVSAAPGDAGSRSGTIKLDATAVATTEYPAMTLVTPAALSSCFRNVHVYCRRRSDGAIQWLDTYRELTE